MKNGVPIAGTNLSELVAAIAASSLFTEALMLLQETVLKHPHDYGLHSAALLHVRMAAKNLVDNTSPLLMMRRE